MSSRCGDNLFIISFLLTFPLIANPEDQQPAFENTQLVSDWLRIQDFFKKSCVEYFKAKE